MSAREREHTNTVCVECAKPAAAAPAKSTAYRACKEQYDAVEECMNANRGQVKICEKVREVLAAPPSIDQCNAIIGQALY